MVAEWSTINNYSVAITVVVFLDKEKIVCVCVCFSDGVIR